MRLISLLYRLHRVLALAVRHILVVEGACANLRGQYGHRRRPFVPAWQGAQTVKPRWLLTGLVALGMCIPLAAHAAAPAPLTICIEDVPLSPWSMPDGTGLMIELLRRVEAQLDEKFEFIAKPWKRCQEETRFGVVAGALGAAESPDRRSYAVFPSGPNGRADSQRALYSEPFHVYIRQDSGASWDGTALKMPADKAVLTQRGYVVTDMLRNAGLKVSEAVASGPDAIRHLSARIFYVAVLQSNEIDREYDANPPWRSVITRAERPYTIQHFHLMIGKTTYERDPQRIEAIWQAIAQVRASKEYKRLLAAATR